MPGAGHGDLGDLLPLTRRRWRGLGFGHIGMSGTTQRWRADGDVCLGMRGTFMHESPATHHLIGAAVLPASSAVGGCPGHRDISRALKTNGCIRSYLKVWKEFKIERRLMDTCPTHRMQYRSGNPEKPLTSHLSVGYEPKQLK